jgi:CubicO group peptidase (beta-lactamase class C family)
MRLHAAPIILLVALLVMAAAPAPAQATLEAQEMDRFLAGLFQEELARAHCPGAIIVVVKDGQILLMRGFGYADPVRRVASNPETDRFYVGSVSKLFTATAAMQLRDQGSVSLQDDVSRYLGAARIEPRFGQPVTLEHLIGFNY